MTTPYAAELIATANAIVASGKGKCVRPGLFLLLGMVGCCPVDTFKGPATPSLCGRHAASRRPPRWLGARFRATDCSGGGRGGWDGGGRWIDRPGGRFPTRTDNGDVARRHDNDEGAARRLTDPHAPNTRHTQASWPPTSPRARSGSASRPSTWRTTRTTAASTASSSSPPRVSRLS